MPTKRHFFLGILFLLVWIVETTVKAQTAFPTCAPTATFTYLGAAEPEAEEMESYSGSAPVLAQFKANPSNVDDGEGAAYSARYEWKIYEQQNPDVLVVHRFEEDMEYTFESSGTFMVELSATFVLGSDTIYYPEEGQTGTRFTVSISESLLELYNAFSPNNDGWNDVYKVKTAQSIVSFRAIVFNRWGRKIHSWDDVNYEWDGRVNGKVIPDGVYFINVAAKGADGREYHIRKDINVMTRKVNDGGETSETGASETGASEE
jgi:gliding motility-associated-like protein